ncbi:hypothetical protein MMC30_008759 [Trapelia coarctata]|nr:hypothetical protein [Trapelia coarctata]
MSQDSTTRFVSGGKNDINLERSSATTAINGTNGTNGAHGPSLPKRHPETGIQVLIVGGGVGGLMAALECWRKGHKVVRILERSDGPTYTGEQRTTARNEEGSELLTELLGDILIIMPSALSVLRHWPDMSRELEEVVQFDVGMSYKKHHGEHIYGPCPPSFNDPENMVGRQGPYVAPAHSRVKFYKMLLQQVARIGLKIEYGKRVKDYFEDTSAGKGGVILEDGQISVADIVIAADGHSSRSAILTSGGPVQPKPSGLAIYRTSYPREIAMKDEVVRKRWAQVDPVWEFWLGPGMYMGVFISPDTVSWGVSPRDDGTSKESWTPDVDPEKALKALERVPGWHPAIPALVQTAPKGAIVHSPLLWRDLRREWTSPGGYVVQIGDSAHSFLPTSGNGATQAMEDAVTLATCLQLGGLRNAPLATKIFNLLRYERVSCAQKMSFVNAQLKQETDWKAIEQDPIKIRTRFPKWIYNHDPEAYVYEKYGQGFAHLITSSPFKNTNFPPGHKFVPWTVDEVNEDIENGKRVEDLLDGDWT